MPRRERNEPNVCPPTKSILKSEEILFIVPLSDAYRNMNVIKMLYYFSCDTSGLP